MDAAWTTACTFSLHVPSAVTYLSHYTPLTVMCLRHHIPSATTHLQPPCTLGYLVPQLPCTFSHSKPYLQISLLNHCTKWCLLNDALGFFPWENSAFLSLGGARCCKQRWRQEDGANHFWYSSSLVVSASLLDIWKLWNSFKTHPFKKLLKYILRLDHVSFTCEFCNKKVLTPKSSDSQRISEPKSKLRQDNSFFLPLGSIMKQSIAGECLNQNQSLDPNDFLLPSLGDCHEAITPALCSQTSNRQTSSNVKPIDTKFYTIPPAVLHTVGLRSQGKHVRVCWVWTALL